MYVLYLRKKRIIKTAAMLFLLLLVLLSVKFNIIGKALYPYPYKETVEKYAFDYEVDPLLVISVIREESHFIRKSTSPKGAIGLMQLMPETAKDIAVRLKEDYRDIDLNKHDDNIRYGTWYLAALNKQFSGNTILALAAYNAGSGRVNAWLKASPRNMNSYLIKDIPFKETREYVQKVLSSYQKYLELYGIK